MLGVGTIGNEELADVRCRSNQRQNSWRVLAVGTIGNDKQLAGVRYRKIGNDKQLAGVRCRNNRKRQTAGGC